jgi:subtilisin family serine protease
LLNEKPGRAIVKSAGNAGREDFPHAVHASGQVASSGREAVLYEVPPHVRNSLPDAIDIWYSGDDRLGLSLVTPDGIPSAVVEPSLSPVLEALDLANGNQAYVWSQLHDVNNGDNHIYVQLTRGLQDEVAEGLWQIVLHGVQINNGHFDAWIERRSASIVGTFHPPHQNPANTITHPGTCRAIITVTSYAAPQHGDGKVPGYASRGGTRDGRQKPEIAAPAEGIRLSETENLSGGTSLAAPYVTGVIALLLQKNPDLTFEQIRECLVKTARVDEHTGAVPNFIWGFGKLDARAACDYLIQDLRRVPVE